MTVPAAPPNEHANRDLGIVAAAAALAGGLWFLTRKPAATVAPPGAPATPTGLVVSNLSASTADVTWPAVATATSYVPVLDGVHQTATSGLSVHLSGLTPGAHTIALIASNANGSSAISAATPFTIASGSTTVQPPSGLAASAVTATTAHLSWSPSPTPGVVQYIPVIEGVELAPVTGTAVNLTALTPATIYTATVIAATATQDSVASTPVTFQTQPASVGTCPWPVGTMVRAAGSGAVYIITTGGVKRQIASGPVLTACGYDTSRQVSASDADLSNCATGPPIYGPPCPPGPMVTTPPPSAGCPFAVGSMVRGNQSGSVYIIATGGVKRHIVSGPVLTACGYDPAQTTFAEDSLLAGCPNGADITGPAGAPPGPGNMVRGNQSGSVWIITAGGVKRRISSGPVITACGYDTSRTLFLDDSTVAGCPNGPDITGPPCPPGPRTDGKGTHAQPIPPPGTTPPTGTITPGSGPTEFDSYSWPGVTLQCVRGAAAAQMWSDCIVASQDILPGWEASAVGSDGCFILLEPLSPGEITAGVRQHAALVCWPGAPPPTIPEWQGTAPPGVVANGRVYWASDAATTVGG